MQEIKTANAPTFDEFPFSQAIEHDGVVHLSGNVPLDPDTGEFVDGGIAAEAEQVMENIGAVLEEAGSSFDNVIKATVFITDPDDFEAFNEVYKEYLDEPYPARSAVVTDLVVDVSVEVEVVAAVE
jgi:2-iminobutanoate/2-iminopropanoate deaminase